MIDLLGGSAESSTRVFGCFFFGLASGAALAAIFQPRIRSLWRAAGFAEIALAILTIPILILPWWTDWIWPAIGPDALTGGSGRWIKFAIAFGVVFPPATMMGLFFPFVIGAMAQSNDEAESREIIWLYAINTFGGAVGLLAVIFIGLGWLGVFGSMLAATILDLAIGVYLLLTATRPHDRNSSMVLATVSSFNANQRNTPESSAYRSEEPAEYRSALSLAFFSGAAVLAMEVLALQMLMLVATVSLYGPAAILFSLLCCLAVAAAYVPRLIGTESTSQKLARMIRWSLVLSGGLIVIAPLIFFGLARLSNWFAANDSVLAFVVKLTTLTFVTLGPAWLVAGTLFPLAMIWGGPSKKQTFRKDRQGLKLKAAT